METIIQKNNIKKLNLKPIKEFFKKEEEKQRALKNARKNASFGIVNGKIIWNPMHPSEAQSRVYWNKKELRKFYGAYALLRGKKLSNVEKNYREDDPEHFFNKRKLLMEKILEGFKQMSEIKQNVEI